MQLLFIYPLFSLTFLPSNFFKTTLSGTENDGTFEITFSGFKGAFPLIVALFPILTDFFCVDSKKIVVGLTFSFPIFYLHLAFFISTLCMCPANDAT